MISDALEECVDQLRHYQQAYPQCYDAIGVEIANVAEVMTALRIALDNPAGEADDLLKAIRELDLSSVREARNANHPVNFEDECPGFKRGGKFSACCGRAGEYNGYGSDGPLLFVCPQHCPCHD